MDFSQGIKDLEIFAEKLENIPATTLIDQLVVEEIQKNIDVGGRPVKYAPSQRAIRENNTTLIDSRTMYDSIPR